MFPGESRDDLTDLATLFPMLNLYRTDPAEHAMTTNARSTW